MKSIGGCEKIIFIIVTTGFIWVAGNKQNNCSSRVHCSLEEKNSSTRNITDEELDQDENSKVVIPLRHAKSRDKDEASVKRDNTFTDVLKDLISMVDKGTKNSDTVTFPRGNPVQGTPSPSTSPTVESSSGSSSSTVTPVITTPSSPIPSQPTSKTPPAPVPTSAPVPTNSAQSTVITPAPSTTSLPGATKPPCISCWKSRKNITVAPGIVITPGGAIILKPPFPLLPGPSQGGTKVPSQGGTNFPGVFPMPGPVIGPGTPASSGAVLKPGVDLLPGAPAEAASR